MGDVIEFPTQDIKLEQLKTQLEKGVTDLEFKYAELDTLHDMLHMREQEAAQLEKDYKIVEDKQPFRLPWRMGGRRRGGEGEGDTAVGCAGAGGAYIQTGT